MRNLYLHNFIQLNCQGISCGDSFYINSQLNDVFICSEGYVYSNSSGTQNFRVLVDLRDYYKDTLVPKTVSVIYNSVSESLRVFFENGDILNVEQYNSEITCVGFVESGIRTVCWSPDQEVVSIVSGTDSVLVMTGTFDLINEIELRENFGEKQFISVGWGKKETQFHGSEGKTARSVTCQVETKVTDDKGIPDISWRGDGALFAVSTLSPKDIRRIRIFSREGILQCTSEPTFGLGSVIAWRPSGNILATTQCLPNKYVVAFFEKNGLRRGEFLLPFQFNKVSVSKMMWNSDSSILSAVCYNAQLGKTYLYFWTVSNYHWYLKQVLEFPAQKKIFHVEWDSLHRNKLHVFREGKGIIYMCYDWSWMVQNSSASEKDGAFVAVIDGADVLLTSFHEAVIPPPLCSQKLKLQVAVNTVVFPVKNHEGVCVVLSDGSVAGLSPQGDTLWHCDVLWDEITFQQCPAHHWMWLAADVLLCCCNFYLVLLNHDQVQNKLVVRSFTPVEGTVSGLSAIPGSELILVHLKDGRLLTFSPSHLEINQYTFSLPDDCVKLDSCRVDGMEVVFGLSDRNRFYLNSREVANNVTSYTLHPHFLLLTTLQHTLLCCRLNTACLQELASGHIAHTTRRVERGSRLVVAVPHDTRVILQMPRGNLECIQPRPLLLHVVATLLNGREYHQAFQLMRKQRINLNLLCDHNLEMFLESVDNFVDSVQVPGWLSLFLSELQEDDVTQTMYTGIYPAKANSPPQSRSKVKVVCEAVRRALLARNDADAYLLPVLTSHVRQGCTEDLEAALKRIKAAKQSCSEEGGNKLAVSAADALKHVLYLVDVNELYDVALGMYDFDLVQLVAAKSQKDPKEYLPFLNHLLSLEPHYQKYCINKHLRRYETALKYIAQCSGEKHFEECLALVKEHNLHTHALELFESKSSEYRLVAGLYAEYLQKHKKWDEAVIMFQRGGELVRALACCQAAGDWRQAVLLAHRMQYSACQLNELYRELVRSLCERSQYGDAAEILGQLLGDMEESVAVLVRGCLWPQAVWAAQLAKRADLLETHIKPGLLEHHDQMIAQLSASRELFSRYTTRLAVVRKLQKLHLEDDCVPPHPECDLFSDTSTVVDSTVVSSRSQSSERTFRSSKNRRKQERKLLSLKEGSPYEDLALIRTLHELVTNTVKAKGEVKCLCKQLVQFEYDRQTQDLQQALESLLQEMQHSLMDIWSPEVMNLGHTVYGPEETVNNIVMKMKLTGEAPGVSYMLLEPSLRIPPNLKDETSWKLDIF